MTRFIATAALALVAAAEIAAGKPLAIALSPSSQTVTEGQSATFLLSKSGGNGRPSPVKVATSDGSFSASVLPGSSFTVPTKDDAIVNGTRIVTVTATASTGAIARAVLTVLDNDVAPPPVAPSWLSAPLSDASGYVRAKTACAAFGGGQRAASAGEVFKMVIAVPYPKTDPSAWGWSAGTPGDGWRGEATLSVWPLDGSPSLILPMACLEGVKPAP